MTAHSLSDLCGRCGYLLVAGICPMCATGKQRRSIRTLYRGILFRSKLEADWARVFDALRIPWEYEKTGRYFGDVFYLADFWLPRSRQFVEVKGVFEPSDCRKIQALLSRAPARKHTSDETPDMTLVACEPDGVFRGWARGDWSDVSWFEFLSRACRTTALFGCNRCGGWWFGDSELGWTCQCCGASNGNGHLIDTLLSPIHSWPSARTVEID